MYETCKNSGLLCFSVTEQDSCSLFFDTGTFVVLKGKGDMGQKGIPEETNQIRETRHSNVSVSVSMYMHFKQPVVSPEFEGRAGNAYEHTNNTCCQTELSSRAALQKMVAVSWNQLM